MKRFRIEYPLGTWGAAKSVRYADTLDEAKAIRKRLKQEDRGRDVKIIDRGQK